MLDRRKTNKTEVERIAVEIEKLTTLANEKKITKREYFKKQLKLFKEMHQYKTDLDTDRKLKLGIKLAKRGIQALDLADKFIQKQQKIDDKVKDKIDKTKKFFKKFGGKK